MSRQTTSHPERRAWRPRRGIAAVAGSLLLALAAPGAAATSANDGVVASVVAAPVTPDGAVAGRVTDLVLNLDADPDPRIAGRTLLAGRKITIELPRAFRQVEPSLPFLPLGPGCPLPPAGTPLGTCNVVVLLHGWPQRPILPFATVSASYDAAASTITLTALQDIIAAPPAAPGIKQIHLLLSGFRNPGPGTYELRVGAETGPGGSLETGSGSVRIGPRTQPSVAFTSAFNAGRPSPVFLTAAPEQELVPYDLLLWDRDGAPFVGVTISSTAARDRRPAGVPRAVPRWARELEASHQDSTKGQRPQVAPRRLPKWYWSWRVWGLSSNDANYLLLHEGRTVGRIRVDVPVGATGHGVTGGAPSFAIGTPVTGVPTARLTVRVRIGSAPGDYVLTFRLNGGNEIASRVRVSPPA
jgi:hypothetical protein